MYKFGTTPSEPQGFLIGPMPAVLATPALAIRREKSITEKYNSSWGIGLRRGMAGCGPQAAWSDDRADAGRASRLLRQSGEGSTAL